MIENELKQTRLKSALMQARMKFREIYNTSSLIPMIDIMRICDYAITHIDYALEQDTHKQNPSPSTSLHDRT